MILLVLAWLLAIAAASSSSSQNDNTVHLDYASYRGVTQDNGVSFWKGIRYAAPPTGKRRFAAPQDPETESGTQDALSSGPLCISTGTYPIPGNQSEDCLFLDVYSPANASSVPVFFWIQGGGFNSNSNANYDGTGLIQASGQNIAVVTFNYRVGPYGFLASKEVERRGSLNNGLKDIVHALQWVHKYIHHFGGDPHHVVLGGDSAGGGAITLLLSAYGGDEKLSSLFHAAAAESQSFGALATVSESQFAYDNLTERTGCADHHDSFECLRDLDLDTLQQENYNLPFPGASMAPLYMFSPTIDHDLVPDYTYKLFAQGRFRRVPVIFGDDTNEGTIFAPQNTSSVDMADEFLKANFPAINSRQLIAINGMYMAKPDDPVYPGAGEYWQGLSNAYGEMRYICPGMYLSDAYNDGHSAKSNWNYHYAVTDWGAETSGYGTQHTIEVNAIWGPQYVSASAPDSYFTNNSAIIPVMQGYWTSFIRSFNPNTHRARGSPEWKAWGDERNRIYIRTGETRMETVPAAQSTRCRYLQSIAVSLEQ